jgi:hypothetical protein
VYIVDSDPEALEQVAVLPAPALGSYAEVLAVLGVAPWGGRPFNRQRPDSNLRTHTFGKQGEDVVVYLILDRQRRVVVLRVLWLA